LLLDTHVLLWAATEPQRLAPEVCEALENGAHEVLVSAVTAWEIAIKQSLGKLELVQPAEFWLPKVVQRMGLEPLPVDFDSALRVRSLPSHHRDPFDRLLIAQALTGGHTLVTRDAVFEAYGVAVLRA
jgi:PIN domain nuclease of toxin-antitoxin system